MNLEDLAALTGKSIEQVKAMLKESEVVEVKLSDSRRSSAREEGSIVLM